MNSDFLCEKRLAKLNPEYHNMTKNTAFVMYNALEKYRTFFPEYTDHSILHSLQVLDFCNRLIGEENIDKLNADELYVLIMGAYLHDFGMGISEADYENLYKEVIDPEYILEHPNYSVKETIRAFHQKFSRKLIYKYAALFDIPTEEHVEAIALVSEGHRKIDLFDENVLPAVFRLKNGNVIRLPYLAALIRLADELDIAADRNLGTEGIGGNIYHLMHMSIQHMYIKHDRFVLDVDADDPALFDDITKEIGKLGQTLKFCSDVIEMRTPFTLSQKSVEINRLAHDKRRITVLDTDVGTDDACALLLLKNLHKQPDYIVASYGNTSLDGACRNALVLKKYFGLSAQIVKGIPAPDGPDSPTDEKNTFHGTDGLAECSSKLISDLNMTESELNDYISFDEFRKKLSDIDSITYITIGTLNNLAYLLNEKEIRQKLSGMYVMGGGIKEFNCSHNTEFNFSKNPQGVKNLLVAGLNTTIFPLDVTNHQTLSKEDIDELESTGNMPEVIKMLRHNLQANTEYNSINAAVLHDTVPVMYLLNPGKFELNDTLLISDEYGHIEQSGLGKVVHICVGADKNLLKEQMRKAFGL